MRMFRIIVWLKNKSYPDMWTFQTPTLPDAVGRFLYEHQDLDLDKICRIEIYPMEKI